MGDEDDSKENQTERAYRPPSPANVSESVIGFGPSDNTHTHTPVTTLALSLAIQTERGRGGGGSLCFAV